MTDKQSLKLFGILLATLAVFLAVGLSWPAYADEETQQETQQQEQQQQEEQTEQESQQQNVEENDGEDNPGDDGEEGIDGEPQDEQDPAEDGEDGEANEDGGIGEDGENGDSVGQEPLPDGETSETNTGNATSTASADTGANITDIDTQAASTTASSTSQNGGPTNITIDSTLSASTTASSTAGTGENVALDGDGVIQNTGNGLSLALDNFFFNLALVDTVGRIEILTNPSEDQLNFTQSILDMFSGFLLPDTCTLPGCKTADDMTTYNGTASANVERKVISICNTGDNYGKSQEGFVYQETGNCDAVTVAVTAGNWFAFNSHLLVLLVNQTGDLNANIVLPEPSFFEEMRGGGFAPDSSLALTNTADLGVNSTSTSDTGDNNAKGEEFSAVMSGNATSQNGGYNGVNQLNPPTCFIISVGGEWHGDVYQMPNGFDRESMPWGDVICGRGGGEGGKRSIHATTTNYAKVVVDAIAQATTGGNTAEGKVVGIKSGDANSFLFVLNLINLTFINQDWIFGLFTISGDWDGDLVFGTRPGASPSEQAAGAIISNKTKKAPKEAPSLVTLSKVASVSTISSGSTVEYTVTLKNKATKLYNVKLEDVLMDPAGATMHTENWELGEVFPHEEIVVKYSMQFSGNLAPGAYVNAVRLTGNQKSADGPALKPAYASTQVTLGAVLGLGECPAYLTHYISPAGGNNAEQVRLLEVFLRDGRGEAIVPDGIYDPLSVEAIMRFQREYAGEVLSPWGIGFATGHVYYTTQKKINELYCRDASTFALTGPQLGEIERYRAFVLGQGPLAPEIVGTPPSTLSEAFEHAPKVVERHPLLLSMRRSAAPSLFETLYNWMRSLTSIPVAEAAL